MKTTTLVVSLSLVATTGCFFSGKNQEPIQALASKFSTFQGIRAGAAELRSGNKELEVFLGTGQKEEGGSYPEILDSENFKEVLYCKAYNEEKDALIEIARLINEAPGDKVIFLYGKRVKDKYKQYYSGLNCVIFAVGVYHVQARKYVYIDAAYGTSWRDYASWRAFVRLVVQQGGKTAVKAVKP